MRAGLIGAGAFGTTLLAQARHTALLEIPVICDRAPILAQQACIAAGIPPDMTVVCETRSKLLTAIESGRYGITHNINDILNLPLDAIVECTGDAEAGAAHAVAALNSGKHVAMVNKETDVVIGALLHDLARRAKLVYTPVDGDQHGLLIGLVTWARTLGMEVICGGKARPNDFIYNMRRGTVTCDQHTVRVPDPVRPWFDPIPPGAAREFTAARNEVLNDLPRVAEADMCEMAIAANATGLMADRPGLHAPVARITELPEVFGTLAEGGLLDTTGIVDVVTCLRRADESGLGGGVFIVVRCGARNVWRFARSKGLITDSSGNRAVIYRPFHLLGIETPISVLCAGLLNISTGGEQIKPQLDLVARTKRDLKAGTRITSPPDGKQTVLAPHLLPVAPASDRAPVPYYMIYGSRLKTDVAAGSLLTYAMLEPPKGSTLWRLRKQQEKIFHASASAE